MIFCKLWKNGMYPLRGLLPGSIPAARRYAADLLNWAAACRDYPYSQHSEPKPDLRLIFVFDEIREQVLKEFNRSNPGCEIT